MPHQCTECGRTFDDGSKEMLSGCPDCGGNKFQFQPSSAKSEARKAASDTPSEAGASTDTEAGAGSDLPADTDSSADPTGTNTTGPVGTNAADDRDRADVERESSERTQAGGEQFDRGTDAEIDTPTGDEDRAQRDARTSPTSSDEIDEARRKMAEAENERLAEVEDHRTSARGAPQGPPTETPDETEAEEFGLDGAVGAPDDQPANTSDADGDAEEEPESFGGSDTDLSALREELNDQFESIKITAPGQYELNLMELYDRKEYIISLQEDGRYVVDIADGHQYEE